MCNNFPVIDKYVSKMVAGTINFLSSITSIKSIDITAKSYTGTNLKRLLKGYIDNVAKFGGTTYNNVTYTVLNDAERILEIAIPPVEMTSRQAYIFDEMINYASEQGVKIVIKAVE